MNKTKCTVIPFLSLALAFVAGCATSSTSQEGNSAHPPSAALSQRDGDAEYRAAINAEDDIALTQFIEKFPESKFKAEAETLIKSRPQVTVILNSVSSTNTEKKDDGTTLITTHSGSGFNIYTERSSTLTEIQKDIGQGEDISTQEDGALGLRRFKWHVSFEPGVGFIPGLKAKPGNLTMVFSKSNILKQIIY